MIIKNSRVFNSENFLLIHASINVVPCFLSGSYLYSVELSGQDFFDFGFDYACFYTFRYLENALAFKDKVYEFLFSKTVMDESDFIEKLGLRYGDDFPFELIYDEVAPAEASGSDVAGSDAVGSDVTGSEAEVPDRRTVLDEFEYFDDAHFEHESSFIPPDILLESYFGYDLGVLNIFFDDDKRLPFMTLSDWHYFFVYEDGLCTQVENTEFEKSIPGSADLFDACNDFVCRQVVYDPVYSRVIGFRVRYLA